MGINGSDDSPVICRCEEVTREEILEAIRNGADTIDAVKRRTRAGMGFCQGKTCKKLIAGVLAEYYGRPAASFMPGSIRLPVTPVSLKLMAETGESGPEPTEKE